MSLRELYHHGILGQEWGKMNGPPYPLGSSDHSSSEKKAGWQKSLDKKDQKWAKKNNKKVTDKAKKAVSKELNAYGNQLLQSPSSYLSTGKISNTAINAYNRKAAELMSKAVSDIRSPSGKVVSFVAKRGEMGVYMALSDEGYNLNQFKNGVWSSGRIAYRTNTVNKLDI